MRTRLATTMLRFVTQPKTPWPRPPLRGLPTVRQRKDGRFEARKMVGGIPHSAIVPSTGNEERDRETARQKWLAWYHGPAEPSRHSPSSQTGPDDDNPPPETVGALFDAWLASVRLHHAHRTWEDYTYQVERHLRSAFGSWAFDDLASPRAPGRIQRYFDKRIAANEPSTSIARTKTALQSALSWAVQPSGWLAVTPMVSVSTPAPRARVPSLQARSVDPPPPWIPNADEVRTFLAANTGDREYNMWLANFLLGLRPSELIALGEDSLVLGPSGRVEFVHVMRKAFLSKERDEVGDRIWIVEAPKYASARSLEAPRDAIEALQIQARITRSERAAHPDWNPRWDGFLFRKRNGEPYDPASIPYHFGEASERAGWGRQIPYTMRHYCLSQLLELGYSIQRTAAWAGHKSTVNIERTYAHIIRRVRGEKSAADLLGGLGFGSAIGSGETPTR